MTIVKLPVNTAFQNPGEKRRNRQHFLFPGELRMTTNCTSIRRALVGYHVTEHLLLSTYANVRLFAFQ